MSPSRDKGFSIDTSSLDESRIASFIAITSLVVGDENDDAKVRERVWRWCIGYLIEENNSSKKDASKTVE